MKAFKTFDCERRSIRSLKEWYAFQKRWFRDEDWPTKSSEQLRSEGVKQRKLISRIRDHRRWTAVVWMIDLTPEARYEYFWTRYVIGLRLEGPLWKKKPLQRTFAMGWHKECGYCQISTWDRGDDICPQCGRALHYVYVAD
ncbi:MAG: hypothetical protein HY077_06560 [Elusimicrobia bacterium]|nr:hypothetical protein [Elusimicrobiota bacterium]